MVYVLRSHPGQWERVEVYQDLNPEQAADARLVLARMAAARDNTPSWTVEPLPTDAGR